LFEQRDIWIVDVTPIEAPIVLHRSLLGVCVRATAGWRVVVEWHPVGMITVEDE